MLFKDYHIFPMYLGMKIYTRRLWTRKHCHVGSEIDVTHKMIYKPEDVVGTIVVEDMYRQPLGMMTDNDAYMEGGYDLEAYHEVLADIYQMKYNDKATIFIPWVIKFRFIISDLIDGNGGTAEIDRYRDIWIAHMAKFGITVTPDDWKGFGYYVRRE